MMNAVRLVVRKRGSYWVDVVTCEFVATHPPTKKQLRAQANEREKLARKRAKRAKRQAKRAGLVSPRAMRLGRV